MKKEKIAFIYLTICFGICLLPFIGMLWFESNTTTENKVLASKPELVKNERINVDYFHEWGEYFEDHFAFRTQIVSADAEIQSNIFGVSNVDTVIQGTDGWLYYSSTLDDYLGRENISDRKAYNIANNLLQVQEYVTRKGADFVFTIAPNKNSLYDTNMPYYLKKKENMFNNRSIIEPLLEEKNICYANLFSAFENEKEILYLKRDSHWNNKGALLAYNVLLDTLVYDHETYETTKALRTKNEYGDLNMMLYPETAEPEWNYEYQYEQEYYYMTETESVEDTWIKAENNSKTGNLLMFRDSFGNTLIPFMANTFGISCFSKGVPNQIELYMNENSPETVILEKVERNISEYAEMPPIMTANICELKERMKERKSNTTVRVETSDFDSSYYSVTGNIDEDLLETTTNIFVKVKDGSRTTTYQAFYISDENKDSGYLIYIPKKKILSETVQIEIIIETEGIYHSVKQEELKL